MPVLTPGPITSASTPNLSTAMTAYSLISRGTPEATAKPGDHVPREPVETEQAVEHDGQLIPGLLPLGGEAPAGHQLLLGEEPHMSLGVTYVDDQQHGHLLLRAALSHPR